MLPDCTSIGFSSNYYDVLSQKVSQFPQSKEELIDCSNELNLTLKQGKMIMLSGIYETDSRKLNICFLIMNF